MTHIRSNFLPLLLLLLLMLLVLLLLRALLLLLVLFLLLLLLPLLLFLVLPLLLLPPLLLPPLPLLLSRTPAATSDYENEWIASVCMYSGAISAGHDRSDGGLASTLLEMAFAGQIGCGLDVDVPAVGDGALHALFSEEVCMWGDFCST